MEKFVKLRNYEKRSFILILILILLIFIFLFCCLFMFYKIPKYCLINGVVFKDNVVEVMVVDEELKLFYKNKYIYINNKKYSYDISNIVLDVLTQDGKKYNLIYIDCDLKNEKENDIVKITIKKENIKLFKIFETIWESE